ncbi:MAG: hypothetical protein WEE50_11345 [Chloroflexota bacterium]
MGDVDPVAWHIGFGVASEMPEAAVLGLEEAVAKAAARHEPARAEMPEEVAAV